MARYELKLFMTNGCGAAILGDVAVLEAADQAAAVSEASARVRQLPRHCFGALFDPTGAEIWSGDAPSGTAAVGHTKITKEAKLTKGALGAPANHHGRGD
jgi:hypothetical protein